MKLGFLKSMLIDKSHSRPKYNGLFNKVNSKNKAY